MSRSRKNTKRTPWRQPVTQNQRRIEPIGKRRPAWKNKPAPITTKITRTAFQRKRARQLADAIERGTQETDHR